MKLVPLIIDQNNKGGEFIMSNEKRTMIAAIAEKIDLLKDRISRSNNQDLFGNILTEDIIANPFLMTKLAKPKLVGIWQDLLQIEFKLRKEGI